MLESELFAFLENTSDGVFAVRETGEICFWNRAAEELFGYPEDEVLGKPCSEILHGVGPLGTEISQQRCAELLCTASTPPMQNFDLNVSTRDGERKWVNLSTICYWNRRTKKSLIVHTSRDITAQKQREELFRKMIAISQEIVGLEASTTGAAPVSPLSSQELEILRMFAAGNSASRIAAGLGISPQTLRNHLHHINQKLHTHSRLEAVTHALQRRLI